MKVAAAILSLFLLTLNILPCGDSVPQDSQQTLLVADNDCDDPGNTDLCSPFCQCQCCSIHIVDFQVPTFQILNPQISTVIFSRFQNKGKEIPHTLFQPPRV